MIDTKVFYYYPSGIEAEEYSLLSISLTQWHRNVPYMKNSSLPYNEMK